VRHRESDGKDQDARNDGRAASNQMTSVTFLRLNTISPNAPIRNMPAMVSRNRATGHTDTDYRTAKRTDCVVPRASSDSR